MKIRALDILQISAIFTAASALNLAHAIECPPCSTPGCNYGAFGLQCGCDVQPGCVKDAVEDALPITPVPPAPRLVFTTVEQSVKDISTTITAAINNSIATFNKTGKTYEDTKAEGGRFAEEVGIAGQAIAEFYVNTAKGQADSYFESTRRIREGKVVDAIWHQALSPVQVVEKSASEAVLESDYLRVVGQTAASAYGGPQGAAAYAAWLTYRQTGDAGLALRVGIITGASSIAFDAAQKINDPTKELIVTAAIGGATIAAAGGSQEAIEEGFLHAGAMLVIQDGMRSYSGHKLSGKGSEGEAYCMNMREPNCPMPPKEAIIDIDNEGNLTLDMSKVDPTVPATGEKDISKLFNEKNVVMKSASRIPGIQGMSVFHDTWASKWDMTALENRVTIVPAIVLTYTGLGAPYFNKVQTTAVEHELRRSHEKAQATAAGATQPAVPIGIPDGTALTPSNITIPNDRIVDGLVCFEAGQPIRTVIHERRPEDVPLWCSDGTILNQKAKEKLFPPKPPLVCRDNDGNIVEFGQKTSAKEIKCRYDILAKPVSAADALPAICRKFSKLGSPVQHIHEKWYDRACSVYVEESGKASIIKQSLTDRDACTATFLEQLPLEVSSSQTCYKADARQ